jgi:hypothetical protein
VYVGGTFGNIGTTARANLAALDATTGALAPWAPGTDAAVHAIASDGRVIFVGGDFVTAGGQARGRLAALSIQTGLATAWNPNCGGGNVYALAVSGSRLVVGGAFTLVGNLSRARLAAIDTTTGVATAWNPGANGLVRTLAVAGNTVYCGGQFTIVRGQPRERLAAIDATSGQLLAWDPGANAEVTGIVPSGTSVFVHGAFATISGVASPLLSLLDGTTGLALGWNPLVNGTAVNTLRVAGGTVFAGGDFNKVENVRVDALAAFPLTALLDAPPSAVRGGTLSLAAAPNPARGPLAVTFALAQAADVRVDVLDVSGRAVARLLHEQLGPGTHRLAWNGRGDRGRLAPGVYLIDVRAGEQRETRRVVLTR